MPSRFGPASQRAGITLRVPLPLLGALRADLLEWLVPGWLPAKVLTMLRSLPKDARRMLVPLPDTVAEVMPRLETLRGVKPLEAALHEALTAVRNVEIDAPFDVDALPNEYRMRIEVLDRDGGVLAAGRDVTALQQRFAGA